MSNVRQIIYATDEMGTPLPEAPKLYAAPAATNSQTYSRDLTNAIWTKTSITATKDAVGIDAVPNSVCTLTATAANGTVIGAAITAASGNHATCWYLKRKTGSGNIDLTVDGGTTWQAVTLTSDYQKFTVDQAAVTNPQIGIRIVTSGDAVIVGNAEAHLNKTTAQVRDLGPIFTTTAAASTDKTMHSFNSANNANDCAWYFEAQSSVAQAVLDGFVSIVGSDWQLNDGTTTATRPWTADTMQKVGVVAYGSLMAIKVGSTWSAEVAYDGALLQGILDLFRTADMGPAYMRDLRRYDISSLQAGKDVIDGLSP